MAEPDTGKKGEQRGTFEGDQKEKGNVGRQEMPDIETQQGKREGLGREETQQGKGKPGQVQGKMGQGEQTNE